jgi:hypothetical protein
MTVGCAQQSSPPVTFLNAASPVPEHLRRHEASPAQLREQLPAHVTSQLDPALHEMLPLFPRVTAQLARSPQSMLHDSAQEPRQVDSAPQASVQLAPQIAIEKSHELAAPH